MELDGAVRRVRQEQATAHFVFHALQTGGIDHLPDEIEDRRRRRYRHDLFPETWNRDHLVAQTSSQADPVQIELEVETIDLQLEIIGVLNPQIDPKPLLEVSALQRLETEVRPALAAAAEAVPALFESLSRAAATLMAGSEEENRLRITEEVEEDPAWRDDASVSCGSRGTVRTTCAG